MAKAVLLLSEVFGFSSRNVIEGWCMDNFMRNIIAWITKDSFYFKKSSYISVAYEQSVKTVNLPQLDCIYLTINKKIFGDWDVNKLEQYVRNGDWCGRNGLGTLKLMENINVYLCPTTSKYFHYAFHCLHLELQQINTS